MRQRLESLLPILVLAGFLASAIVVNLLLSSAESRGVDALEQSATAEVAAIAGSQNQRVENSFTGFADFVRKLPEFELAVDSAADKKTFDLYANAARGAGFYLVDDQATITQGVLLRDNAIGGRFGWPGYDDLISSPGYQAGTGGVLPISQGYTTDQPVFAYVFPLLGETGVRGSFVVESAVAVDSDFNSEISQLRRGKTGEYIFYDNSGSVIASNDSSLIAKKLDDHRLLDASRGVHHFGDDVVVLADVPAAGWRVAFRQDADEFEESLSGPLQSVGRVLIFALLLGGFLVTAMLYRRLRAARAEQERLRILSDNQQEFISIVSHELRTPVAGVLGFLETSLDHWDDMDDDARRAAVTRAASNARRLQAMTRDVLDTQNIEAGRLVHVFEPLDIGAEVRTAVDAATELDPDRTIAVHLPDDPVLVRGDADRLQQVLANLLENARKNSPSVEPIEVTVKRSGSTAEVIVSDHGPGIAEESLDRIFDKFVRGRGDSVTGTGLGLYISRQIVNAHGGRIWAESDPGHGATFRFVIPQAASTATAYAPQT